MKSKLISVLEDAGITFFGAYVTMLASGESPTTSLYALVASALAGALNAVNPRNTRYGIGSTPSP